MLKYLFLFFAQTFVAYSLIFVLLLNVTRRISQFIVIFVDFTTLFLHILDGIFWRPSITWPRRQARREEGHHQVPRAAQLPEAEAAWPTPPLDAGTEAGFPPAATSDASGLHNQAGLWHVS